MVEITARMQQDTEEAVVDFLVAEMAAVEVDVEVAMEEAVAVAVVVVKGRG
jgi:hypothetical protein